MTNEFYVIIAGSRNYNDYIEFCKVCNYILQDYRPEDIHLISGGAKGADKLAERYARDNKYKINIFLADWDRYGKSAGYIRNNDMHEFISTKVNKCCICFWDGVSKGTQHNFDLARKNGELLYIWNYKEGKFV